MKRPFKRAKASPKQTKFQKLTLFFYDRPRLVALLILAIMAFGITSYTTLLKREGFPSITIPFSLVNGSYLVNDASKVDQEISKPVSDKILKLDDKIKTVSSQSGANFFSVYVEYKEGTDAKAENLKVEQAVRSANILPSQAKAEFSTLSPGVDERGDDMLIAFYDSSNQTNTLACEHY